jgi:hypothetical protein
MASVFKRGRWVDGSGRKCAKDAPGAKWVESRFYTVQIIIDGKPKLFKGHSDKGASEQLAAELERNKARGERGLIDPYQAHRKRALAEHVADWSAELKQLGRDDVYIGLCEFRMGRMIKDCGWKTLDTINIESFIRWRQTATAKVGTSAKVGANIRFFRTFGETARPKFAPSTHTFYFDFILTEWSPRWRSNHSCPRQDA